MKGNKVGTKPAAYRVRNQMNKAWIGVDLDGTLAHYEGWTNGSIGKPIEPMLKRVKKWLRSGKKVKIFTARVSRDDDGFQERLIKKWSKEHLGQELEVTCVKDLGMIELWDDKAMRVELNTGKLISLRPEESAI